MTVAELIERLRAVPQDLEIKTEGCDCDGDCEHVVIEKDHVLLARSDAVYASRLARNSPAVLADVDPSTGLPKPSFRSKV